jgi:hypothetical protein
LRICCIATTCFRAQDFCPIVMSSKLFKFACGDFQRRRSDQAGSAAQAASGSVFGSNRSIWEVLPR